MCYNYNKEKEEGKLQVSNTNSYSHPQINTQQNHKTDFSEIPGKHFFALPKEAPRFDWKEQNSLREAIGTTGSYSKKTQQEAYIAGTLEDNKSAYDDMSKYIRNYNIFASNLRRSDAINTYIDNGRAFNRIGERASILTINQLSASQRESVRHVGIANEGEQNASAATDPYSLRHTTQAIRAYNLIAQSAKDAQNHATYLQNSMAGLNSSAFLGSA